MLKTSKILGLTIATILTASIAALTLSNQAFAAPESSHKLFQTLGHAGKILAGQGTQLGKELAGQTKSVLGDVCLSCWNGLAAHETQ
ncbi:MAG: hypothetical protein ACTHKK_04930 [Candidatus Nitrosocosmicus sp.]